MGYARFFRATLFIGLLSLGGPGLAHHSGAAYDSDHPKTFKATVNVVNWTNPHVNFQVTNEAGEVWSLEVSSPGVMSRSGWSRHSLQPGDQATFQIMPLRSGAQAGFIRTVTLSNGQVLNIAAPTEDPE